MTEEKWTELNELLSDIEGHDELKETVSLITESIKLSKELNEINKKLQVKEGI